MKTAIIAVCLFAFYLFGKFQGYRKAERNLKATYGALLDQMQEITRNNKDA